MIFGDIDITKESVLQSLKNAGFDYEERDIGMGAVIEAGEKTIPVPRDMPLFETIETINKKER